ncbi:hypothetical protein REPUB_Repub13aG0071400 [Reevesia pubescens]
MDKGVEEDTEMDNFWATIFPDDVVSALVLSVFCSFIFSVLGSFDLRRCKIFWRHLLGSNDVIDGINIALGKCKTGARNLNRIPNNQIQRTNASTDIRYIQKDGPGPHRPFERLLATSFKRI